MSVQNRFCRKLFLFTLLGFALLLPSCNPGSQESSEKSDQDVENKTDQSTKKEGKKDDGQSKPDNSSEPYGKTKKNNTKNRLANASSPYLRMHADNPINWYPWGEEAFRKAKEEDKPIFLSIGYYTCHWCHVMERKVFMNEEIARQFNDLFVNIKVDREQRPAVDHTYMSAAHKMGRQGGWPLSVFMTPDKKPFFISTYIPPEQAKSLVSRLDNMWHDPDRRQELLSNADKVADAMKEATRQPPGSVPGRTELDGAYSELDEQFDEEHAGFGQGQKFPSPHNLIFLLRYWHRTGTEHARKMVTRTLDAMQAGGMYDHTGFGFHRYSTDRKWKLPHFEKMLYDQAMLTYAYAEGYQATGNERYRRTARNTIQFVNRDLGAENGGYYSALASGADGVEGAEYVWTTDEVRDLLSDDLASLVIDVYSMTDKGNYRKESSGERTGKNVLRRSSSISHLAEKHDLSPENLRKKLKTARKKMYRYREEHKPQMGVDSKILTDWNGMMIAALARSGRVLGKDAYTDRARRAANFVLSELKTKEGRLKHRFRNGDTGVTGKATDYAYFTWGLIELYQTTSETKWLKEAIALTDVFVQHYWDRENGGFYFSPDFEDMPLGRQKQARDGARPSANSVAMWNLFRLGRITANKSYEAKARRIGIAFSDQVSQRPSSFTMMMTAVDLMEGPSYEVVISGDPERSDTRKMLKAVWNRYLPRKVVVQRPDGDAPEITTIAEYTKPQKPKNNKATAYVCMNYACKLPTTSISKMKELLNPDYSLQAPENEQ